MQNSQSKMNLEKLIALREAREWSTFPVSEQEICKRYERLYTGAINDVLREFCLVDQALPPEIHPLRDDKSMRR